MEYCDETAKQLTYTPNRGGTHEKFFKFLYFYQNFPSNPLSLIRQLDIDI